MSDVVWEAEVGEYKVEVANDYSPMSPREMNDNLGKLIGRIRSYDICDFQAQNTEDYDSWEEWRENELPKDAVVVPVYGYIHGGITISTTPYGDRWDSGQIGYYFAARKDAREWLGVKRLTKKREEEAEKLLISELEELDVYLTSEHYQYTLYKDGEIVDSSSSYPYGDDMVDHMADNWQEGFDVLIPLLKEEIY